MTAGCSSAFQGVLTKCQSADSSFIITSKDKSKKFNTSLIIHPVDPFVLVQISTSVMQFLASTVMLRVHHIARDVLAWYIIML